MHEAFLAVYAEHRKYARNYIADFMIANKDKESFSCLIIPCKSSADILCDTYILS